MEARGFGLVERGGWHANIDETDERIQVWLRWGFNRTRHDRSVLKVSRRVPGNDSSFGPRQTTSKGVRLHHTLNGHPSSMQGELDELLICTAP